MNFYEILQVAPGATQDEIRNAYFAAAKTHHPDLIDRNREPERWEKANETMGTLNGVYGVLGDEESRRDYDAYLRGERPSRPALRVTPPSMDLGELAAGAAHVSQLDPALLERLYQRVHSDDLPGYRVPLGWPLLAWSSVVLVAAWTCWLLTSVGGPRWDENTTQAVWIGAVAAALLLGPASYCLYRRARHPLGRHLLITRLHLVETAYNHVRYWPLWSLRDFKATDHYSNGSYSSTLVRFNVGDKAFRFKLSSQAAFQKLIATLQEFNANIPAAEAQQAWTYFFANNDFRDLSPPALTKAKSWVSPLKFAGMAAAGVALLSFGCGYANARLAARTPTGESAPAPLTNAPPASGDTITYHRQVGKVPVEISAPVDHDCLVSFYQQSDGSNALAVYVRRGESVRVMVPPGVYQLGEAVGEGWTGYASLFNEGLARRTASQPFSVREGLEPAARIGQALFDSP